MLLNEFFGTKVFDVDSKEQRKDDDKIKEGELPIWPVIDDEKPKDTDGERGLHIIEPCQFAKYEWLSEANHGMRKDFEDKILLFPRFDAITIGLSNIEDGMKGRIFDTLEQCVMEIEELKDLEKAGLLEWREEEIYVPIKGRLLARRVAMTFDRHLRESQAKGTYSKVL